MDRPDQSAEETTLRRQLERMLADHGADQLGFAATNELAGISFRIDGRVYQASLPMPGREDPELTLTAGGRVRSGAALTKVWRAERVRRWKALAGLVRAALEAEAANLAPLQLTLAGWLVLPDGRTV